MMKDPRHGDPRIRSPLGEKMRVHRSEWHPEPSGYAQEKRPLLRNIRSLSPHEVEMLDEYHHLGTSIEREDYIREYYESRDERAFRRPSPLERQVLKWSKIDEEVSLRERRQQRDVVLMESGEKYTLPEYRDFYGDRSPMLKHFGDKGPSSSRYDHDSNLRTNDRSLFMPPQVSRPVVSSSRTGGSLPSSSSGNMGILREEEELRFLSNLRTHKLSARESYKEDDKPLTYSDDVYDPVLVSSHLKDFGSLPSGVSKENLLNASHDSLQSYGYGKRQVKHGVFVGHDGYGQGPPSDFARNLGTCLNDPISRHHDSYSPDREEHWEYYHEHGRRDEIKTGYRSEVYRKEHPIERRGYISRDFIRPTLSVPVVDEDQYIESSHKSLNGSSSRGHHPIQGKPFTNYSDTKINLVATDRGEFFGSGTNNFGMKLSNDYERTAPRGDYGFGRDAGPLSNKERLKRLQITESDRNIFTHDLSPRRRMKAEELSVYEPSERMHKRRYPIDDEMSRPADRSIRLSNKITSRPVEELSYSDEQWTNESPGSLIPSKRLRFNHPQYQRSERPYLGRNANQIGEPDDWSSAHDLPTHLQRRSIDRYTKGDGSVNIKSHLRSCTSDDHKSYTMDRRQDSYQSGRSWKRILDNDYDVVLTEDGNFLEDLDTLVKPDLPEDSDEFKQLVDNLFLQFCKQLNQKPTTRRRYREQGNAGILLCIVCGRHSKEFLDTRGLVTHAFMSHKVGKRAHHLALHKAVCVLMGWKSVKTSNGACVFEMLPETEALSLKEDLILWPPLVIIHNSFILNSNSDEQVITIEHMEAILRGMGFSGGKIKVRYGNPANQNILVVKFLPTFSGLQEAEKLHKYYLENKRGRGEFQKHKNDSRNSVRKEAEGIPVEKEEPDLYGYMAIIEDMDKLDFDTKKKCAVKSKKAIQAIADAPLKTD